MLLESNTIVSLPHSGLYTFEKVLHRCTANSANENVSLQVKINKGKIDLATQKSMQVGLFLVDPAIRLKRTYDQLNKDKNYPLSFKEFYSAPAQINNLTKKYSLIELNQIGFIGFESKFLQSILIAQSWLGWKTTRITHQDISLSNSGVEISSEDLKNIKQLNVSDYEFFSQAEQIFERRWNQLLVNHTIALPVDKKIIIHVGPPKTGTSAIQYWLNNNSKVLEQQGFFYPTHGVDNNNISSGNFENVIKNASQGRLSFVDKQLINQLIETFLNSGKQTLLLSSEHFFYNLPALFLNLSNAKFIFYVRHPLTTLESSYHQQVKRHRRTTPFGTINNASFSQLEYIKELLHVFSVEVEFRYFSPNLFIGGNIISDFCDAISASRVNTKSAPTINRKYALEALELMRICNAFASKSTLSKLDQWLQNYSETRESESLITKEMNERLKPMMYKHAQTLGDSLPSLDNEKLKAIITEYAPQSDVEKNTECCIQNLIDKLIRSDVLLAYNLHKELSEIEGNEFHILKKSLTLSPMHKIKAKLKMLLAHRVQT